MLLGEKPKEQTLWEKFKSLVTEHKQLLTKIGGFGGAGFTIWYFSHKFNELGHLIMALPKIILRSGAAVEHEDEEREDLESFKIGQPKQIRNKFERKKKENIWEQFIYDCLLDHPMISWIYGPKRTGKSTLLKIFTYQLQSMLEKGDTSAIDQFNDKYPWLKDEGASNFRVFYVNLEDTETPEEAHSHIRKLREQVHINEKNGKISLVVVGMLPLGS